MFLSDDESRQLPPDPLKDALREIADKSGSKEIFVEIWVDIESACPDPALLTPPESFLDVLPQIREYVE